MLDAPRFTPKALLEAIPKHVDADEFYEVYRPLLGGWSEDKLPGGLLLCGTGGGAGGGTGGGKRR